MTKPRVVASIEARMKSQRFPGKVLMDIEGTTSLSRLLKRLRRANLLDEIVLATSHTIADDALVAWAKSENLAYHRGDETDVLARVVEAHQMMRSDIVVKVCGDTPLLDPEVIDTAIDLFLSDPSTDVVTTTQERFFPDGVDAEVFSLASLIEVSQMNYEAEVREHVSLQFYRSNSGYKVSNLTSPQKLFAPALRFVIDYPEDLEMVRNVYRRLLPISGENFNTVDVIRLLKKEPQIAAMNAKYSEFTSS